MLLRDWLGTWKFKVVGQQRTIRGTRVRRKRHLDWSQATGLESLEQRIVPARVNPYLQNPATDAMTVMWFSQENVPGQMVINFPSGGTFTYNTNPVQATALAYAAPEGTDPGIPYQHRVRAMGLQPGTTYNYTVTQGSETFTGTFTTIPEDDRPIRFTVYADSETEPESTGARVNWDEPFVNSNRLYVVDQTEGYKQNLAMIESRNPNFMAIAGDIVESGGEQRDWDEFWRHNSGELNDVAGKFPLLTAPGNHEDYGGPGALGGYTDAGSIRGRDKYATYFEYPSNGSGVSTFEDRYYRIDYGPITFISLDVTNGQPHATGADTNWLLGDGPGYPDFNPGSTQYQWLEAQLADAQEKSQFVFVQFHHVPYSVGPHGFPAGNTGNSNGTDTQSGVPVRVLTPLFVQYGVDAVFSGHDESYQHSVVDGIHFYDVGMGGDGLRGPSSGTDGSTGLPSTNPYQVFTAHLNAPEVWNGNQLVSGGKHYGHMEVDVFQDTDGKWKAVLEPAYAFPLMDASGNVTGWERRVYDDVVTLVGGAATGPVGDTVGVARNSQFLLDGNQNHQWDSTTGGDLQFQFGAKTDVPVVGDWDGDGVDQIAVFRGGYWYFDQNGNGKWDGAAGGDKIRRFGNPTDIPIAGDWDGNGTDEIGVFRNGEWYFDGNGNGTWDRIPGGDGYAKFGTAGDKPVVGDWTGNGKSKIGVFRNGSWYLDLNGNGLWNGPIAGDGVSRFGNSTDTPIVGDWNADGKDKIGVFRGGWFYLDVDGTRAWNPTNASGDVSFRFGNATDLPLAGTWANNSSGVQSLPVAPSEAIVISAGTEPASNEASESAGPSASQFSTAAGVTPFNRSDEGVKISSTSKKEKKGSPAQGNSQTKTKTGKIRRLRNAGTQEATPGLSDL